MKSLRGLNLMATGRQLIFSLSSLLFVPGEAKLALER